MDSGPNVKLQHLKIIKNKPNWSLLKRKQVCPNHSLKLKYECQHSQCPNPYFCPTNECLQNHFHDDLLCIRRFSQEKFTQKLKQAQMAVQNMQEYQNQTSKMKTILQQYKRSLVDLFSGLEQMRLESDKLFQEHSQKVLDHNFLKKVERINEIDNKISSDIDSLKNKFKGASQPLISSSYITTFLIKEIPNFSWETSKLIWSSFHPSEKLVQIIQNKPHLLFLFIGMKKTVGSYFPTPYISISEKTKKAPGSFIFLMEDNTKDHFIKYKANEQAESHIQMTEKLLISQGNLPSSGLGVQTFGRHLECIFYFLPTKAYIREDDPQGEMDPLSEKVTLSQFLVYQLSQ